MSDTATNELGVSQLSDQEAFQLILDDVNSIPLDEVVDPNVPIKTFSTECEDLIVTYRKDSPYFAARKIDTSILAGKLDIAVGALRAAEIRWHREAAEYKKAQKEWAVLHPEAYELRDEAIASLDFVLPENCRARRELESIMEGTGHNDMLMDLGKIYPICVDYGDELDGIAFFEEATERIGELAASLTGIYGQVNSDKKDRNEARILRDRIFLYCRRLCNQIKRAARLVFRKDRDMLERYSYSYYQGQYSKKKAAEASENSDV